MISTNMSFELDRAKCVRCGQCVQVCSRFALETDPASGFPQTVSDWANKCNHCGHCLMICPAGAITLDGTAPESCLPVEKDLTRFESLPTLVRMRRSCRKYQQKNVDREVISELLNLLRFAPTGVNFHQLHLGVIDDIEVMNEYRARVYARLAEIFESGNLPQDAKRYESTYQQYLAGQDPVFRTAPHMLMVSVPENAPCAEADPMIAISYFELLANAKGLGTVWFGRIMNLYRDLMPEIVKPFHIPEGYRPGYAILFGESALHYQRTGNPEPYAAHRVSKEDLP